MIIKLQKQEVHWVFNVLINRLHCVGVGDTKSPVLVSKTVGPRGCDLSSFIYTLYINEYPVCEVF